MKNTLYYSTVLYIHLKTWLQGIFNDILKRLFFFIATSFLKEYIIHLASHIYNIVRQFFAHSCLSKPGANPTHNASQPLTVWLEI